ncbi:MAG: hypothetical protein WC562_00600 [Dehalococcoidia bacterium]
MFKITGLKAKKGQVFILVLMVMAIGLIVISPLLDYLSSSYRTYTKDLIKTNAYYAADAMMEYIIHDIQRGVNVYELNASTSYSQDDYLDSGMDVTVTINDSMPQPLAPPEGGSGWTYLDPGILICPEASCDSTLLLSSLGYGKTHDFPLYLVEEADIEVNWTMDDEGRWFLFCGTCSYYLGASMWMNYPNGSKIAETEVSGSSTNAPLTLNFDWTVPEGGTGDYTVQFKNTGCHRQSQCSWFSCDGNENRPSYSASVSGTGDTSYTWVKIGMEKDGVVYTYQDYSVTATASKNGEDLVSITAYIRHSPGSMVYWLEQTVEIAGWQVTYH